jgi:hypothetical protein
MPAAPTRAATGDGNVPVLLRRRPGDEGTDDVGIPRIVLCDLFRPGEDGI